MCARNAMPLKLAGIYDHINVGGITLALRWLTQIWNIREKTVSQFSRFILNVEFKTKRIRLRLLFIMFFLVLMSLQCECLTVYIINQFDRWLFTLLVIFFICNCFSMT